MDPSSYYDPFPTVTLERPLVVSGMIGTETRQVAHRVASLHGIRFTDFDAALEHSAGASRAALREAQTDAQIHRLERQVAEALFRDEPFGIVSLPDRLLSLRSVKRAVERRASFVALSYDVRDAYRRLTTTYRAEAPLWVLQAPGPEALRAVYRQWNRRFTKADLTLAMERTSWRQAASKLVDLLGEANWRL